MTHRTTEGHRSTGNAYEKADVETLFPSSITVGAARRRRRRRVGKALTIVALLAVVAVVGGIIIGASGSSDAQYRTVAASNHDVAASLQSVATIEPVEQATVAFPVSGSVTSVGVKVGQKVTAGQKLASVDTTSLMATLHQRQASLAKAQLALTEALNGQTPSSSLGSASAQGISFVEPGTNDKPTAILMAAKSLDDLNAQLAAAQQAVLTAQKNVDAARADAASALQSATTICSAVGGSPNPPDGSSPTTTTTSPTGPIAACQDALDKVLDAQKAVSDAQTALVDASNQLDQVLQKIEASLPPPTSTPPTSTPPTTVPSSGPPTTEGGPSGSGHGKGTTGSTTSSTVPTRSGFSGSRGAGGGGTARATGGGSSRSAGPTSTPPSAADLVAYQSAVDAASASVTEADQSLAQATIASPVAGTVVAVNLAPGQSVGAGSSSANIVIQGGGGYEATTNISLTKIASVQVGQAATVTQDGSSTPVTGTVASISAVPSSNTSSTTYGVVIGFDGPTPGLLNGAIGTVSITTGSTTSALAVPTSAVTTTGGLHTVTVLEKGKTQQVVVQVGVVGATWTSITRGLTAGQEVVLADVKEPLPGSATSVPTNTRGFGNGSPFLAQFANRRPNS